MSKKALVVIDLQIAMIENPWNMKLDNWEGLITNVQKLIINARKNNDKVIFIKHSDKDPEDPFYEGKPTWELIPELGRKDDEPIFYKSQRDAFTNPELANYLRENSINEVILCGAQSEYCVLSTTLGAIENGLITKLVKDAHGTIDNDTEKAKEIILRINNEIAQTEACLV